MPPKDHLGSWNEHTLSTTQLELLDLDPSSFQARLVHRSLTRVHKSLLPIQMNSTQLNPFYKTCFSLLWFQVWEGCFLEGANDETHRRWGLPSVSFLGGVFS